MNNKILLNSGGYLDYANPSIDDIHIEDIAHSLSREYRYMNMTDRKYSVAEHCCYCHDLADTLMLRTLMHDASEAYLRDIPTPLKNMLPEYKKKEDEFEELIANKFGFEKGKNDQIHKIDMMMLKFEKQTLLGLTDCHPEIETTVDNPITIHEWSSEDAYGEFMMRFNDYFDLENI